MVSLARVFEERGFWGAEDAELVSLWVRDLESVRSALASLPRLSETERG